MKYAIKVGLPSRDAGDTLEIEASTPALAKIYAEERIQKTNPEWVILEEPEKI